MVYNKYTRGDGMNGLRAGVTLILVGVFVLVGLFYNELRGYDEVARINEWVLYYCSDCREDDGSMYDGFILLNGFTEMTVEEAFETNFFDEDIEEKIQLEIILYDNEGVLSG
jgi:hypothetical protein